jgi:hypothetical protein
MTAFEGPSVKRHGDLVKLCRPWNQTRKHTIDLHQLLIIHLLFLLFIIKSFIELEGLRLDIFMVLFIRFRIADVITKPREGLVWSHELFFFE